MVDSYAQSGRTRKQKELAKSEKYAETGVGKAQKSAKKEYAIERRTTKEYYELQVKRGWPAFLIDGCQEWQVYTKYILHRDAVNALQKFSRDKNYEYRITHFLL